VSASSPQLALPGQQGSMHATSSRAIARMERYLTLLERESDELKSTAEGLGKLIAQSEKGFNGSSGAARNDLVMTRKERNEWQKLVLNVEAHYEAEKKKTLQGVAFLLDGKDASLEKASGRNEHLVGLVDDLESRVVGLESDVIQVQVETEQELWEETKKLEAYYATQIEALDDQVARLEEGTAVHGHHAPSIEAWRGHVSVLQKDILNMSNTAGTTLVCCRTRAMLRRSELSTSRLTTKLMYWG